MKLIQFITLILISLGATVGQDKTTYAMNTNHSQSPAKRKNAEAFLQDSNTNDNFTAKRASKDKNNNLSTFITIKHITEHDRHKKALLFHFLFHKIITKIGSFIPRPIIINPSYTLVRIPNYFFASNIDRKIIQEIMKIIIDWAMINIPDEANQIFLQQDLAEFLTTIIPKHAKKYKTTSQNILQSFVQFAHNYESSFLYEVAILLNEELKLHVEINPSECPIVDIYRNPLLNVKGFYIKSASDFTRSIISTAIVNLNYDILAFSASDFETLTNEQVDVFTKTLAQSHPNTINIHNSLQNISESSLFKLFSTITKNNSIIRVSLSDQPASNIEPIDHGFDQVFQNRNSCNLGKLTRTQVLNVFLPLSFSTSLNELSLNNNNLHLIPAPTLGIIFSALCQVKSLEILDLTDIHLGHMNSDQLSAIFQNISKYKTLKKISLHTNNLSNLSPKNLTIVSKNLLACGSLETIMLQNNEIGEMDLDQLQGLFEAFSLNNTIKKLFLDSNEINKLANNQDLAIAMFSAIGSMKKLEELYLCENDLNKVDNDFLEYITNEAISITSLNFFCLEGNELTIPQKMHLESLPTEIHIPFDFAF